jgi:hypothetical protein
VSVFVEIPLSIRFVDITRQTSNAAVLKLFAVVVYKGVYKSGLHVKDRLAEV